MVPALNILMLGDVVGRAAREAVLREVPKLREAWNLDFVLVNGDNAAGGFGILPKHCEEFFAAGVDVITGGDHVWDQKDLRGFLSQEKRLLRPLNLPPGTPGFGSGIFPAKGGRKVAVFHPLGQIFMPDHPDCPFAAMEAALAGCRLGKEADVILVDFHAEATSEKMAMGQYLDGRVTAVFGTHTHVPTADTRILKGGTAYQTDLGMCGDYDSVIGFDAAGPLSIFTKKIRKLRMEPAAGTATLSGLRIAADPATGLAMSAEIIKIGGVFG